MRRQKNKTACVCRLFVLLACVPKILSRGQNVENQTSPREMFSTVENVDIVENSLSFPDGKPQNSWFSHKTKLMLHNFHKPNCGKPACAYFWSFFIKLPANGSFCACRLTNNGMSDFAFQKEIWRKNYE